MASKIRIAIACVAAFVSSAGRAQDFRIGSRVQDFAVTDPKGAERSYSTLKRDTTVIVFLATRCPVSNAYNERMEQLFKDYAPKGVGFVFVNANRNESAAEVEEHARNHGFTFPVYKDNSDVAGRFGAQVTPETYVIDRTGTVRYHGAIDDSQNPARIHKQPFRAALDAVLAGKEVQERETKAFGCTIKRGRGGA